MIDLTFRDIGAVQIRIGQAMFVFVCCLVLLVAIATLIVTMKVM